MKLPHKLASQMLRSAVWLAIFAFGFSVGAGRAQPVLYVANAGGNTIGEYNAVTGAAINAAVLVNGQGLNGPVGLAMDNSSHLFVCNARGNTIGQYDADDRRHDQ